MSLAKFIMVICACGLFQTVFFAMIYKLLDNMKEDVKLDYLKNADVSCPITSGSTFLITKHTITIGIIQVACALTLVLGFSFWVTGGIQLLMNTISVLINIGIWVIILSGVTIFGIYTCIVGYITTNKLYKHNYKLKYYLVRRLDYELRFGRYWSIMFNVLASVFFAQFSRSLAFAAVEMNFLGSLACGVFVSILFQKKYIKQEYLQFEREVFLDIILEILPRKLINRCHINKDANTLEYNGLTIDPLFFKTLKLKNQFKTETYLELVELLE